MRRAGPWVEVPAYLALALACAWVSNALAGPTRRLSWRLRQPSAPVVPAPAAAPVSTPAALPAVRTSTTIRSSTLPVHQTPAAKTVQHQPAATPPPPDPKAEVMARFPPLVQETQAELRGQEAVWLHAHGALFLDARRTAMYVDGHIPGAKSFSAWEDGLPEKIDQLALFTVDLKLPVVVYCSGGECHDSHLVAQKLWLAGFRNLRIYRDGYPDWEARKLPVTKGGKP